MKKLKKALCLFLALTMCLGLVNLSALADVDKCDECLWTGGNHSENCSHYSGSKDKEPEKPEEPQKPEEQPEKSEETPKCEHKHCTEKLDEATCEKDGLWKLVCDDCGREVDSHVCLKLEHVYVDGKCKYCGQDEPSAKPGEPENPDSNKCPQIDENGNPKHVQYSPCEDKDNDGKCDECGAALKETCDHRAGNHEDESQYKAPTCTEKGQYVYVCDKCKGVVDNKEIAPLGHDWGSWIITKEPTCTEPGEMKHDCKRDGCNASETQAIQPKGHTCPDQLVWDGDCHWSECTVCGEVIGEKKLHEWKEVYTNPATCEENGEIKYDCATIGCNASMVKVIPAKGHDWDYEHGKVVVKPTVNKVGTICYTCKNDDSHTKYEALKFSACDQVDENGNHKKEYLVTKEPTCTEKGAAQWWCPSCETVFANVELPAKGHLTKIVVDNEPTCTEKGNEHEVCTVCGFTVENKENPALGHDWSGWLSDGADGHHQVCDRCGIHSGIVEHRFGAWETVKEATATEKGEEKHTCLDCGYVETRETNMLENSGNGSGNNGGSSDTTRYTLNINYVYEDGTQASAPYSQQYTSGGSYNVPSPAIEGYSPDYAQVMGNLRENLTVTVTYTLIEDIGDQDPPLADAPEDKDPIGSNPSETDVPDEQPPLTDISDEEPPLVDSPDQQPPMTDLPAEWPPLAEVADPSATDLVETDISDEDVPLASVPQTGDISLVWYVAVAMSAMGLVALTLKKREDEED